MTDRLEHDSLTRPDFARSADTIILGAIVAAAAVALAIGTVYATLTTALVGAALLTVTATLALWLGRGTRATHVVLALCLSAMVALHIQLGRGTLEFHFGVFVTLALLLIYRDWRPILASAVFFAVHHVLFDRLQAGGIGVYCTPEPDFLKVVLHAGYVIGQTGLEILVAVRMAQAVAESDELDTLVRAIDTAGAVSLDLREVTVASPGATRLKQTIARMHAAMVQVQASAANIESVSAEVASGNADLSTRTEQAAASLQATASSMDQLTQTVRHTAESSREADEMAATASTVAVRGGEMVAQVVVTMGEINASSQRIGDIIGTIDSIAFQTNILALNAAVEAARAGEQGRGFAVVAAEVRSLAKRSADAAREIKSLIGESVESVAAGSRLVSEAGATMTQIVQSVHGVVTMIRGISHAAGKQSAGIGLVNGSVSSLDAMTQQNAALVEEGSAAAESLRDQARQLGEVLRGFRLETASAGH